MKLFCATPLFVNGFVHQLHMRGALEVSKRFEGTTFKTRTGTNIAENREELTEAFWSSSCSHLLFVDADIGFRAADVVELARPELDVISGTYVKRWAEQTVPAELVPEERGQNHLIAECAYVPAGFLLLSRAAVDAMRSSYADEGLWMPMREHRRYVSEDVAFCRRWRALGGRVWLHEGVRVGHVGEIVYRPE